MKHVIVSMMVGILFSANAFGMGTHSCQCSSIPECEYGETIKWEIDERCGLSFFCERTTEAHRALYKPQFQKEN